MKDSITAKVGYRLRKFKPDYYGEMVYCKGASYLVDEETRLLVDGEELVMICQLIPKAECEYQKRDNECFCIQERFTTVNGKQYEYYLDIETNEDFIVRIR